jgi:FMN reductase
MSTVAVISCSLNPGSRSRVLAREAAARLGELSASVHEVDLIDRDLPLCDGAAAYGHASIAPLAETIRSADAVLLAVPIYNYDVNSAAKTMIELTGKAWMNQVVGFLCAAGGHSSYMAPMAVANSLMLDFRCTIIPRFVYATGADFDEGRISNDKILKRTQELARITSEMGTALREIKQTLATEQA